METLVPKELFQCFCSPVQGSLYLHLFNCSKKKLLVIDCYFTWVYKVLWSLWLHATCVLTVTCASMCWFFSINSWWRKNTKQWTHKPCNRRLFCCHKTQHCHLIHTASFLQTAFFYPSLCQKPDIAQALCNPKSQSFGCLNISLPYNVTRQDIYPVLFQTCMWRCHSLSNFTEKNNQTSV